METLVPDRKTVEIIAKILNSGLVVATYYAVWYLLKLWRRLLHRRPQFAVRTVEIIEHVGAIVLFLNFMIYKVINNYRGIVP